MRLRFGGAAKIWALAAVTAATAVALAAGEIRHLVAPPLGFQISWPLLAALFFLAEVFVVHMQFRRGDAHSFSLNEVPLVLGLFFVEPSNLMLAQVIGALIALVLYRRQQPIKAAFNMAHLSVETGIAILVFGALRSGGTSVVPMDWVAALVACGVAAVLGAMFVGAAISLSQGRLTPTIVLRNVALALTVAACNTGLGLGAVTIFALEPRSAWLMIPPVVVVFLSYRAFSRQREKHESLEFLFESTRALQHAATVEDAMRTLLDQTRSMFRAEIASATFFATGDEPALRTTLGPGDEITILEPVHLDPREGVWARVAAEGQALLFPRPIRNERLREYFAGRGMRDAMVAPLTGESGVVGTLLVGNRLGEVSTFDETDLRLFETLANHASTSLQKVRLVSRLSDALAKMTEMNRLKDDFVATVSHELRTPLTSIQGFVQTMLRPDVSFDTEEQHELLTIVDRQTRRLRGMIEDLLVVSRIETHELRPTPFAVSVPELIREVVTDVAGRQPGHRIETAVDEPVGVVLSDHEMIYRILSNLVDNAIKYSPEGSRVGVLVSAEGHGVKVSVSDQGGGIDPEMRERVFERFFQIDSSRTRTAGGAGLGLYICRQLASALSGRIWIERSGPDGSTFSLWIPDAWNEIAARLDPQTQAPPSKPSPRSSA
jgi:signal transduction histidine kinase